MNKVIDLNYIRLAELDSFMQGSNYGVLFEYHFMEMSKGNSLVNLRESLLRIAKFSDKFIVCRPLPDLIQISGTDRDVNVDSFIDRAATANLAVFCDHIYGEKLDHSADPAFENLTKESKNFFAQRTADASQVTDYIIGTLNDKLSSDQKSELRRNKSVGQAHYEWILREAILLAAATLRDKGYNITCIGNCLWFRYILSGYFLCLYWIIHGGIESQPIAKMVNDITDMMYVGLSTYFDGILSKEKKVQWIAREVVALLNLVEKESA